ncbi:enoyl-CoA hydratase/isomerase family protein [Paraburkholderia dipogonis]|uniref:Enoyl-CoA hydratase/isomerase family protein n=1 Tax=Paraburkholderia dipogonis TaxID=1211383 RepID=A0A4Y8NB75_9BURK|nr:enoyl-CoA hydratase/isomerase family protein [Paraburkholderia dipogonis]TFE46952.1 enoyl-CoA hydratase/isomerase family protein [Paraburkholderia dipogonis]
MTNSLLIDDSMSGVRVVTLNRPERMNALDGPTLAALNDAVRTAADPALEIRVIVIRGSGRAFCAGNDLKWLASGVLSNPAAHMEHQDLMQDTFSSMEGARQIVIASVNGHALAGGFELALACDIVVADENAELGDAHLQRNLLPSGGSSQRLPRKIGFARAMYYLITGRRMTGRDAERMGLVSLAVSSDELDSVTMQLAAEIGRIDADALAAMKQMARRALEMPLNDGLSMERWMQYRYRIESPSLVASVLDFAQRDKS